jgi:hypothetical protein
LQEGNTERRGKHFRSEIRLKIQTILYLLIAYFSRPEVQAISCDSPYSVGGDREHRNRDKKGGKRITDK